MCQVANKCSCKIKYNTKNEKSKFFLCLLYQQFLNATTETVGVSPTSSTSSSSSSTLSSSSSYICHGVGQIVDPFRSHVSRSLFKVLPWFLLPVGEQCFITLGNLFRDILVTYCTQFLSHSSNLSKIGVIFNSFGICAFVY